MTLFSKADSWFMNVNRDLLEKKRTAVVYAAGAPVYREKYDEVAGCGYQGFEIG